MIFGNQIKWIDGDIGKGKLYADIPLSVFKCVPHICLNALTITIFL